jgi:hypothetical protein
MTSLTGEGAAMTEPTREARGADAYLVGPLGRTLLGGFLLVTGLTVTIMLVQLWPTIERATAGNAAQGETEHLSLFWGALESDLTADSALLLLVILASALGSYVHAVTSFTDYVGNRRLARSWMWWYGLRLFVGVALAILFYFAIRGGFFAADATSSQVNPFGIAAISGLVGLFSKQATDKLREVFDTLFRTSPGGGDDQRKDSITNPRPFVAGIEPAVVSAGSPTTTVILSGEGFVPDSVVRVRRAPTGQGSVLLQRETRFVAPTEMTLELLTEDLLEAGYIDVTVFNPEPGGGSSNPVRLDISPVLSSSADGGGPTDVREPEPARSE